MPENPYLPQETSRLPAACLKWTVSLYRDQLREIAPHVRNNNLAALQVEQQLKEAINVIEAAMHARGEENAPGPQPLQASL